MLGKNLYCEGGGALEQATQRTCRCCIPGGAQGQGGWSSEQPGLMKGVSAYDRGLGIR